jgi:type IV pilus assembly protein PilP
MTTMKNTFIAYAKTIAAVSLLAFCLFPASCSQPENKKPAPAPKAAAAHKAPHTVKKPAAKSPEVPDTRTVDAYSYDPTGKIDPFMPLIVDAPARQTTVAQTRRVSKPLTPLQKYDLKDLQLVAVISTHSTASALIQDPSGFGYIVKEGILIGKNEGVLKKIIGNGIIIEEQILNSLGEPETKISTLTIQHK